MRKAVYTLMFLVIAVCATLYVLRHLPYTGIFLVTSLPIWASMPVLLFGHLPLLNQPDPTPAVALVNAGPILLLAGRRLYVFTRTGQFMPAEFRTWKYGLALLSIGLLLGSGAAYLFTKSVVLTVLATQPCAWALLGAFMFTEFSSVLAAQPTFRLPAYALMAVIVVAVVLPWESYLAVWGYERLCATRGGEKIATTTRAQSYLMAGEGTGQDGFRLATAVDDVLARRVQFIEIERDPRNSNQSNSLRNYVNSSAEPKFIRVSIVSSPTANCVEEKRWRHVGREREALKEGECLEFAPISGPASRYRIQIEAEAKPLWYSWRVFETGVKVTDLQSGALLGESTYFEVAPGAAGSRARSGAYDCPPRAKRRPVTDLHRKVLLGAP